MIPVDQSVDLLVVGAGPAGVAALRSYREKGGPGRAVVVSDDPDATYERPPLSKDYLRGETRENDFRLLEDGELDRLGAEILDARVVALDPAERQVRTDTGQTLHYRWCVLATGAAPARLPVPGADDPRLRQLRTLDDARRLKDAASSASSSASSPSSVAVIGSGFVGCEAAVSLARLGLEVTLITDETAPHLKRLGAGAAARIERWLEEEKVRFVGDATITSFEVGPETVRIRTEGSGDVEVAVVLQAVGATPRTALARSAGLAREEGRIVTDARMRTSAEGVLAAGDAARAHNVAAGRSLAVEHWEEARRMGEIAGATAAGAVDEWGNVPGFWSQVGDRQLKYAAWGDGYEEAVLREHDGGGFTVWYTDRAGATVGALTFEADDDYDRAQELIEKAAPPPL